jgi:hypothetical protein
LNYLKPLKCDEVFFISERIILQDENDYRYTVSIMNNNKFEKTIEFKKIQKIILFDNKRKFLVYGKKNYRDERYQGEPLFIIDGDEGTMKYLDNFWPGFFLIDEQNIIINRFYQEDKKFIDDIFIYNIITKEIIYVYDMNAYLASRLGTDNLEYYELDFPDYSDGKNKVNNGRIRVYFNQWGEDGPQSFYAHLNIQNPNSVYIE